MRLFEYAYFRMYEAYEAKNDSPKMRALVYISLCKGFIFSTLLIIAQSAFHHQFPETKLNLNKWVIFLIWATNLLYNYLAYTRKGFDYFEDLFSDSRKLNKTVRIWMLIMLPFAFFILGIYINIKLFGGQIIGKPVVGLLE